MYCHPYPTPMPRPPSPYRAALAGAALSLLAAAPALAQPALFAPQPGAPLAARQAQLARAVETTRGFLGGAVGRARADLLLAGSDVSVALPDGRTAALRLDRVERRGADDASWFGASADGTASGVFVVRGGGVTGTVRVRGGLYALRPLTGGLHALARVDERAFRDHGEGYAAFEAAELARVAREAVAEDAAAMAVTDPVVTVLVPYTAAVRAAHADMGAFVQLAVDETNQAFANSGVAARLALAYSYQTPTVESASIQADLDAVRGLTDGRFDEAHGLRDAYEADVVSLLGEYGAECGIGFLKATRDLAFSVVGQACATGYYSFGHEIGHNFGAHHDPASGSNPMYAYGHGYVSAPGQWRTVMAYANGSCGSCTRIPYFSNPDVSYGGTPTGDATTRDNARVLDVRAATVAGFNKSLVQMAGTAGWRMLASPVPAMTVDDLAVQNLVQGVPGYYPEQNPNLFTGLSGAGWAPSAGTGEVLVSGRGFMWYLFDELILPGGPSNSFVLPVNLQAPFYQASPSAPVPVALNAGGGWNLLGNPFASGLDLSGLPGWATGGALGSAVAQVWDPASGSYRLSTTLANTVGAWQGFLVENATATGVTIPASARVAAGALLRPAAGTRPDGARLVAFEVEAADAATGAPLFDRAAALYLHADATDAWDLWDASELRALAPAYAALAFAGSRDGAPVLKAQESRPYDPAPFAVPMTFEAAGTTTAFTLRWPDVADVPATWTLVLEDLATGARVDLRAADAYAFTAEAGPARRIAGVPAFERVEATAAARFVLHVTPGVATGVGPGTGPAAFALAPPAPNPAAGTAALRYELPQATHVTVEVLDLLGRRVATVVDGPAVAGRHEARLDAAALAAGVYVVRMRAGDFVQTRRLTVAR